MKKNLLIILLCCGLIFSGCGKDLNDTSSADSSHSDSSISSAEDLKIYYECELQFFVNPEKPKETVSTNGGSQYGVYGAYGRHIMDNMIKLLESESFTEKLVLNNSPLPEKGKWANLDNEAEVALNLDAKIDAASKLIATSNQYTETARTERAEAESLLLVLRNEWDKAVVNTDYNKYSYSDLVYEKALYDNEFNMPEILSVAQNNYTTARLEAETAELHAAEALEQAEFATEQALEAWRATAKYKEVLAKYKRAVTYSCEIDGDVDAANSVALNSIYVNISVLNDRDFAEEIVEAVKCVLPVFVEANMVVPSGYSGTTCQLLTEDCTVKELKK